MLMRSGRVAFQVPLLCALLAMCSLSFGAQDQDKEQSQYESKSPSSSADTNSAELEEVKALLRELSRKSVDPSLADAMDRSDLISPTSTVHIDGRRIRSAYDLSLSGISLERPGSSEEAERVVRTFFAEHATLFGLDKQVDAISPETIVSEVRGQASQRLTFQQHYKGLPVLDGSFAAFFDEEGAFNGISGSPWSDRDLPKNVKPRIPEKAAIDTAKDHVRRSLEGSKLGSDLQGEAQLTVSGRLKQLLWKVNVTHSLGLGVDREILIGADNGDVVADHDLISLAAEPVSVRYMRHPDGIKNATAATAQNPPNRSTTINVNPEPYGSTCLVRLQRLGSGRARMWNARLRGGTSTAPIFSSTMTLAPCDDLSQLTIFQQMPQSSNVSDSTFRFNEQSTYVWAQRLKTQLDNWGRKPGTNYGYYYPVDANRDVNVEIIVNGDSASESDWCSGATPLHGCSRNNNVPSAWFPGVAKPRVVFLFNSIGNANSPQFVGQEFSASYSIIAHEVGHFISWTYGGWSGTTKKMRSSLSEGMSMALPAIWAKQRWRNALAYTDSIEVTTGSRVGGSQWAHHTAGNPL
ncbi:MAG: hypothetical protein OEU36_25860, partial [Gammaproteobacteria bacterium]|nr:hypothetical protein [Gammaproteobacteria bacterium]